MSRIDFEEPMRGIDGENRTSIHQRVFRATLNDRNFATEIADFLAKHCRLRVLVDPIDAGVVRIHRMDNNGHLYDPFDFIVSRGVVQLVAEVERHWRISIYRPGLNDLHPGVVPRRTPMPDVHQAEPKLDTLAAIAAISKADAEFK